MDAIGGYFSLELPYYEEYHKNAIKLHTGRNCLEYILRCRNYQKVYIPYYTCEVILEPFHRLNIAFQFYHINIDFEIEDTIWLQEDEALLYTNYFGLKQTYVERLAESFGSNLIVDNSQAFFSRPIKGIDTFYTCRKFFGVPDGAYLYTECQADFAIKQSTSFHRCDFLLKRLDISAEEGYSDFGKSEEKLSHNDIMLMSKLTDRLMHSIDYAKVAHIRRANFIFLSKFLSPKNQLRVDLVDEAVPMVYPFVCNQDNLRSLLIKNGIYVATYWSNVLEWCETNCLERNLAKRLLPLPIDQRYNFDQMKSIINNIMI